jgi:hypothetical protein
LSVVTWAALAGYCSDSRGATGKSETSEQFSRPAARFLESDGILSQHGAMATMSNKTARFLAAHIDAAMESETFQS